MNSVTIDGHTVTLNEDLIAKQGIDGEAIAEILGLHARKLALYKAMETAEEFSQRYSKSTAFEDVELRRQDTKNRQNSTDDLKSEVKA
jgi:hypothetical protein